MRKSVIVTLSLAARHEAIYERLAALNKQTGAMALRRPRAEVPEAVRVMAEGLLFDVRPFLDHAARARLPVAAGDYAGLAAQLGQGLAEMSAFEAEHTQWDPARRCFVWRTQGNRQPVQRLRQQFAELRTPKEEQERKRMRAELDRRLEAKWRESYERGYAHAKQGLSLDYSRG